MSGVARLSSKSKEAAVEELRAVLPGFGLAAGNGIVRYDCPKAAMHVGGSPKTFAVNWAEGWWKCQSTRCDQQGGYGGESFLMWMHGRDWQNPLHRRATRAEMKEAGLDVESFGPPPTPEQKAKWEAAAKAREQARRLEAIKQAEKLKELRGRLVKAAASLPAPPFNSWEMDQPLEDALKRCSTINPSTRSREYYFPAAEDKRPALVSIDGRKQRLPWGRNSFCDPAAIRKWAEGFEASSGEEVVYPRRGLHCGRSGILVFDADLKNFALGGCPDPVAEEYYADFSQPELETIHAWQVAIVAILLAMSGNNYACTPGGGVHIFFADFERRFAPTALTSVKGSVFDCPVGFCETKAGEGYVICYQRFGDGNYQPVPKLISTYSNRSGGSK